MSEEIEENLVDDICGECGSAMRVPELMVGELRCGACAEALPFLGLYDKRKIAAKDAEIARLKAQRDALAIAFHVIHCDSRNRNLLADEIMRSRFGLRIVGGQVEEVK